MQEGWKTYKLGDIASIKGGKRMPKGTSLQEERNRHPYIRVTDMASRSIYKGNLLFVPESAYDKISRYIVSKEDVILSIVGTIGNVAIIDKELEGANLTENCVKITDLKNVSFEYIYYYLMSPQGKHEVKKGVVGSTQPKLPLYNIKGIEVSAPSMENQKAIASILSALDDKIELNLQMNKTLEEMAMALYKHWFVDFGPFQDGEFVDSELGKIPKGWEVKRVESIAEFKDPHPSHRAPKIVDDGYPFAGIGDIDSMGNINLSKARKIGIEAVAKQSKAYEINSSSVGFGRVGTVGKVVRLRPQKFRYSISPTLAVINSKTDVFSEFIYYMVKSEGFQTQVLNNQTGSTRPTIGIQTLRALLVALPQDEAIIISFKEAVNSFYLKGDFLNQEIQTLTKLRDTMLPKLISGEVRVKDIAQTIANTL